MDDSNLQLNGAINSEVNLADPEDWAEGTEPPRPDPDEMLALLTAADVTQRMLAARAFCEIEDARAVPALIELLSSPCPLVRVSAAYALGRNPSPSAVEPLIQQLEQDWNGYVRKGVTWALGNCRDSRSLLPLTETLLTDISAVRLWAASSLGQMAEVSIEAATQAVPPLVKALTTDSMAVVRSNAAWALGQLCRAIPVDQTYGQAIDALIKALGDEDMGVQEDARAALVKLGDARGLEAIEAQDEAQELEGLI